MLTHSKFLLTFLFIISFVFPGYSQIQAITSSGDEVLLYDDGTWEYADSENEEVIIPENPTKFSKSSKANFLVKSKKVNIGIWLDSKQWGFSKSDDFSENEFTFKNKTLELHGMLITEAITIPIETLKNIAIRNARNVSNDLTVVKEEYRNVNGVRLLSMQMACTIQGIRFVYHGYYFSNENGTIQLLVYSSDKMMERHAGEAEDFLNGFVEVQ